MALFTSWACSCCVPLGRPTTAAGDCGIKPEAYETKRDVDFIPLREQDPAAVGFTVAA
ncbi:hypothetical protein [Streptomyces sp. NPDC014685]|uniref:hypothetical protein n=1 Tax=Streptomyces sp. NPDC014685 TaxID=3364881 RepID=UPI0036F7C2E8